MNHKMQVKSMPLLYSSTVGASAMHFMCAGRSMPFASTSLCGSTMNDLSPHIHVHTIMQRL